MTERQPEPMLLQKFVSDGVETLRYEGESLRDAIQRHMLAVAEKKRAEGDR